MLTIEVPRTEAPDDWTVVPASYGAIHFKIGIACSSSAPLEHDPLRGVHERDTAVCYTPKRAT